MRLRVLSVLHALIALNAIGGGLFGVAGAQGVPLEWLRGTPFSSYLVPSLILLLVVGGVHGIASVLVWRHGSWAQVTSLAAGIILLSWISVQLAMIGYVSWLQPAVGLAAIGNVALASRLTRVPRVTV